MTTANAGIALNRFGLGARPDEMPPADPSGWLLSQLDRFSPLPPVLADLANPSAVLEADRNRLRAMKQDGQDAAALAAARQAGNATAYRLYHDAVAARLGNALQTDTPFPERLVFFWSNHFCISAHTPRLAAYAGVFERDAIRPHVLGRFADMARAAVLHPAMLNYLNQDQSIGPGSPAALVDAQRDPPRRRGLNENLAREAMELHTLGVRSGYDQADVTEFSRALTGWTVSQDLRDAVFRPRRHEPGPRTVLGRLYPDGGSDQATAILASLSAAPATANHVAVKLARHFAGDDPPPALARRLAAVFLASGGDLPSLYRVLVEDRECWAHGPVKFKTPWDWTVSALRGLGETVPRPAHVAVLNAQLGQPAWKPGSPAGWDDTAAGWAAPDGLMQRVRLASVLAASHADGRDARSLAPRLLPDSLSPATAEQVARAESPATALALLLASPDFLRR